MEDRSITTTPTLSKEVEELLAYKDLRENLYNFELSPKIVGYILGMVERISNRVSAQVEHDAYERGKREEREGIKVLLGTMWTKSDSRASELQVSEDGYCSGIEDALESLTNTQKGQDV